MASRCESPLILGDLWGPFRMMFSDVSAIFPRQFPKHSRRCLQNSCFADSSFPNWSLSTSPLSECSFFRLFVFSFVCFGAPLFLICICWGVYLWEIAFVSNVSRSDVSVPIPTFQFFTLQTFLSRLVLCQIPPFHVIVWCGMVCDRMVWYSMVWYGTVWYRTVWHCMV